MLDYIKKNKKTSPFSKVKKPKIVICFFGVIGRGLKYTWKSLNKNLVKPLQKEFDVDIFVCNNNIGNSIIDGVHINNDYNAIPYDFCEEMIQSNIDKRIAKISKKCTIKFHHYHYNKKITQNAMRIMYVEYRVGCFLQKKINKYKCAVVCSTDFYLGKKININDVKNALKDTKSVFTTNVCDWDGYTDGFYIGNLKPLIPILKRFNTIHNHLPTDKGYEYLLKLYFLKNKIKRKITDMPFCKIRANGYIYKMPWAIKEYITLCKHLRFREIRWCFYKGDITPIKELIYILSAKLKQRSKLYNKLIISIKCKINKRQISS
jgi:hypothetical protein